MSLPVRGAWIEIAFCRKPPIQNQSLPVRGAWIEIDKEHPYAMTDAVAPRKGSVD